MSFFKETQPGELVRSPVHVTKRKAAPLSGQTASGYGSRVPCGFLAQTEPGGKFRRVYCRIFSNIGTCYVVIRGERVIVDL